MFSLTQPEEDVKRAMKGLLRFNIAMENAVFVHVVNGLENLIHEITNSIFREIVTPALDRLIHIHVHQLKY